MITATATKVGQPTATISDPLKLAPSLRAMLERIERHSSELLELSVTAGGGREYGKVQKLLRAGYVVRVDHPTVKGAHGPPTP